MKNNKGKIILANWKMRLDLKQTRDLAHEMVKKFKNFSNGIVGICPNFISLPDVKKIISGSSLALGAQNVFWEEVGAYTGEISPKMLTEVGCDYVLIGHSERREFLQENYEMIHKKIKVVLSASEITPVICIGENWDERKTDRRNFVLYDQMHQALSGVDLKEDREIIIAYEPIWAIGSGTAIEPEEAQYAHKIIKMTLSDMFGEKIVNKNFKVIYGGSVNGQNAKDFVNLENLDGLLVGGASLKVDEFYVVAQTIINQ
ncbi:MAG: triose-phosphate isomerase [Candidatus Falkowbacteria bacterium]|nr:triose-phosphate isomerase [Candidatus Falkowbacteria bacterium]